MSSGGPVQSRHADDEAPECVMVVYLHMRSNRIMIEGDLCEENSWLKEEKEEKQEEKEEKEEDPDDPKTI